MKASRFSLLFLSVFLWAGTLRASSSIVPVSVSGGTDTFSGEFQIDWTVPDPVYFGQHITGAWEGGTWLFYWSAWDFGISTGGVLEGQWRVNLVTTWNNGWAPGGLNTLSDFTWGYNGGASGGFPVDRNIQYNRPPLIAHDFSGNDLKYWLYVDAHFLEFQTTTAKSGKARVGFNVTRVWAVPEGGAGAAFAIVVAGMLVLGRRFRQSASG